MKKGLFACIIFFWATNLNAQLSLMKLVGKNSGDYQFGYGGYLKFAIAATEAADITLESGVNIFMVKDDESKGMILVPLKLGYRQTLNGTGIGFYVEPQVGYNLYGINSTTDDYGYPIEKKFKGIIATAGFGYLAERSGWFQMDLGLIFESAFYSGEPVHYVGLRLTHNISFGRRE